MSKPKKAEPSLSQERLDDLAGARRWVTKQDNCDPEATAYGA
jgi:hypothetical protein